jgi:hypothetical protein
LPPECFDTSSFCFCLIDLVSKEGFECDVDGSSRCVICEVDPGNVTCGTSCQTYPQTTQTVILKTINILTSGKIDVQDHALFLTRSLKVMIFWDATP